MSLKEIVEKSPVLFFLSTFAGGAVGAFGVLQFMGYEVLSPAAYLRLKSEEVLNFTDQTKVEYKLAPSGYDSVVSITANFESYANEGSDPDSSSIEKKARLRGVISVNGKFCSKTYVYHNRGPNPEQERLLRGTTSCVTYQKPNETLLINAERKEAKLESARMVAISIKRSLK